MDATITVSTPARSAAREDVPASLEVRVDELVGVELGPVHVLVRGQVEDHVGALLGDEPLDAAGVAHVGEDVAHVRELGVLAGTPVGGEPGLVAVDEGDPLRAEAAEEAW